MRARVQHIKDRLSDVHSLIIGISYQSWLRINNLNEVNICYRILSRRSNWIFYNIAAGEFQSLPSDQSTVEGHIWYQTLIDEINEDAIKNPYADTLLINKLALEDQKGNRHVKFVETHPHCKWVHGILIHRFLLIQTLCRWEYCTPNTTVNWKERSVVLQRGQCISPWR